MRDAPLPILYRDERFVAVHKPAGLLVHRSELDRHETQFAVQRLRDQIGQRVWPLHRLDKPTSGVLLFALDEGSASRGATAFQEGRVGKQYLAVVRGHTAESGRIDHALTATPHVRRDDSRGYPPQPAVTDYRRLATTEQPWPVGRYTTARYSLVAAQPHQGRKHQIRRHLKHLSHPLLGDTTYGNGQHNRLFRERLDCRRLLLAAVALELPAGLVARQAVTIRAPLAAEFAAVVRALEWEAVARDHLYAAEAVMAVG